MEHVLSSVRLALQLLQVPWRLVGLSLLSLTDLIPISPSWLLPTSLVPRPFAILGGTTQPDTLSRQSINFENFLTFKS